ncbi:MAG TPA: aldose epimerase family protein [Candidatus Marinimicrobia bacterium]|jgi:aldose 1-epimerase|nr:MAG: Aldose 1-epimerase precursor [Candidatus Marinimicrobia bacterium ADurb.Bin030]HPI28450.1 aldose epimerase family protein [Candidatus Neomarinimicrobiota bacterium]HPY00062.1 aldose epimerase family protein [Candidatus Neomarinimicrobiota bacterium]HQM36995.1 aldose epimerase family protein [Candidatus Neomarinimicrobiota bacterium]
MKKYKISNDKGVSAEIISYGAIVVSLTAPNRNGQLEDVILGFDDLASYEKDNTFQGSIVGRYGNRIAGGKFSLDGKVYQLNLNDGPNHLHGGPKGFFKVIWDIEQLDSQSVRLTYVSPDGEEGYPGEVKISVVYTITDDDALRIDYYGTTDRPTILNPTSHCYFNLSGTPKNTILDHELMLNADFFTPIDEFSIPTGEIRPVAGTPLDFREPKPIGRDINAEDEQIKFGKGYDHNWVINGKPGQVRLAATVYESKSGRLMECLTDQAGLQFYSGNFLDGSLIGKGGIRYNYRCALCLEAQAFPDSPNKPHFPSVVLRPGEEYRQTTIYRFSVR